MKNVACLALVLILAAGCAGPKPLELACMDRFDIDTFVMGCWAFPDRHQMPEHREANEPRSTESGVQAHGEAS